MYATTNRDLWLQERRKTIGSSDAYVIMGVAPFGKPDELERKLWISKMGMDADEDTPAKALGRHLEHGIADGHVLAGAFAVAEPFPGTGRVGGRAGEAEQGEREGGAGGLHGLSLDRSGRGARHRETGTQFAPRPRRRECADACSLLLIVTFETL